MRALALAAALLFITPALAQGITGPARVVDGDTLEIAGQRIRLHGIDAPESRQWCRIGMAEVECGKKATKALRRLIAGNPVVCQERDVDRYGRIIAVCLNAEGQDVGAELVRQNPAPLFGLRCVDAMEADALTSNVEGVAIDHTGRAGDVLGQRLGGK